MTAATTELADVFGTGYVIEKAVVEVIECDIFVVDDGFGREIVGPKCAWADCDNRVDVLDDEPDLHSGIGHCKTTNVYVRVPGDEDYTGEEAYQLGGGDCWECRDSLLSRRNAVAIAVAKTAGIRGLASEGKAVVR